EEEQAEEALERWEVGAPAVGEEEREGEEQQAGGQEILRPLAEIEPVAAAPGAGPRREEAAESEKAGGEEQAEVVGVGEEQAGGAPEEEGVVGGGEVEDLPQHYQVQDEA